jgi:hypothetical protein
MYRLIRDAVRANVMPGVRSNSKLSDDEVVAQIPLFVSLLSLWWPIIRPQQHSSHFPALCRQHDHRSHPLLDSRRTGQAPFRPDAPTCRDCRPRWVCVLRSHPVPSLPECSHQRDSPAIPCCSHAVSRSAGRYDDTPRSANRGQEWIQYRGRQYQKGGDCTHW